MNQSFKLSAQNSPPLPSSLHSPHDCPPQPALLLSHTAGVTNSNMTEEARGLGKSITSGASCPKMNMTWSSIKLPLKQDQGGCQNEKPPSVSLYLSHHAALIRNFHASILVWSLGNFFSVWCNPETDCGFILVRGTKNRRKPESAMETLCITISYCY